MEPLIWNKPPIWNTLAANQLVFRIRGFTALQYGGDSYTIATCRRFIEKKNQNKIFTSQRKNQLDFTVF